MGEQGRRRYGGVATYARRCSRLVAAAWKRVALAEVMWFRG
jgi:hypothetical protein